ncbi:MAG: hypothetical protein HY962_06095 [Ignavibacteriae bacterium]|nr:hypothetical protein [Ignavibacteriota bacterium]
MYLVGARMMILVIAAAIGLCPLNGLSQVLFSITPLQDEFVYPNPVWVKLRVVNTSDSTIYLHNISTLKFPLFEVYHNGIILPSRQVHINELPRHLLPGRVDSAYISLDTYGSDMLSYRYKILDTGNYIIRAGLTYAVGNGKSTQNNKTQAAFRIVEVNRPMAGILIDSLRAMVGALDIDVVRRLLHLYENEEYGIFRSRITTILVNKMRYSSKDPSLLESTARVIARNGIGDPTCLEIIRNAVWTLTINLPEEVRLGESRRLITSIVDESHDTLIKTIITSKNGR